VFLDQADRLSPIARFGCDFYVSQLFQQRADAGANQLVVVGKQNSDRIH